VRVKSIVDTPRVISLSGYCATRVVLPPLQRVGNLMIVLAVAGYVPHPNYRHEAKPKIPRAAIENDVTGFG
jgi:hypothetical protein